MLGEPEQLSEAPTFRDGADDPQQPAPAAAPEEVSGSTAQPAGQPDLQGRSSGETVFVASHNESPETHHLSEFGSKL